MSTEPTKVPELGASSDKNDILTNSGAGFFQVASGFGLRLSQDLFPKREDFNGLFNLLSKPLNWFCKGGFFTWDSDIATGGGYPIRAIVKKADNSGYWSNTVDNNTSNPDTGGAGWVDFSPETTDAAKWDAMPVGTAQPFVESVMGVPIATWLAAHPKWDKLNNAIVSGIEGRAMAVAGNGHAASTQAGSDDAIVVSHTHTATQESHSHANVPLYMPEGDVDRGLETGSSLFSIDDTGNTSSATPAITVESAGVSGTDKNIQRTQYLDWIIKVA